MKKILVFIIIGIFAGFVFAYAQTQQQVDALNQRISTDTAQISALQSGVAESNSTMQGQLNQIAILNNEIQISQVFLNESYQNNSELMPATNRVYNSTDKSVNAVTNSVNSTGD